MNNTVIHTEGLTKFYGRQRGVLDVNINSLAPIVEVLEPYRELSPSYY